MSDHRVSPRLVLSVLGLKPMTLRELALAVNGTREQTGLVLNPLVSRGDVDQLVIGDQALYSIPA